MKRRRLTSKRKKSVSAETGEPQPGIERSEIFRRGLLGLVTALIVVRPLVAGEDVARLIPGTGVAGSVITLLWLLAGVGWAAWRAWARSSDWRPSIIEAGLLGIVVMVFVSTLAAAEYKHPAWLVVWEWLAVLIAYCLVRQLARTQVENDCLLAVLMASAVSLSLQAILQAVGVGSPPASFDPTLAHIYGLDSAFSYPDPAATQAYFNYASATFANPSGLGSYLVLLIPSLAVGWFLYGQRPDSYSVRMWLAAVGFALACVVLGMTHSWFAVLALVAVGIGFLELARRHLSQAAFLWSMGSLVALGLGLGLVLWQEGLEDGIARRLAMVKPTFGLIHDYEGMGVGPGNFAAHYPAYLATAVTARSRLPENAVLEMWATCGLLATAFLIFTWYAFFRRTIPELIGPMTTAPDESEEIGSDPRWEFYIGGITGLTLAFVFNLIEPAGKNIWMETALAIVRSIIWFGAFALFERIPWTARHRTAVLTAGVAALLVCLLFSSGLTNPALAQPLWIMVALGINSLPDQSAPTIGGRAVGQLLPIPLMVVVCWTYILIGFYPGVAGGVSLNEARKAYPVWRERIEPRWRVAVDNKLDAKLQLDAANRAYNFLQQYIIKPLENATRDDPSNVQPLVELAFWNGKAWQLFGEIQELPESAEPAKIYRRKNEYIEQAILRARQAQTIDPAGCDGVWVASQLWMLLAQEPKAQTADKTKRYLNAANHLRELARRDPTDPQLRFLLVEAQFLAGDTTEEWRKELRTLMDLDALAGNSSRRLSDQQRDRIKEWLKPK